MYLKDSNDSDTLIYIVSNKAVSVTLHDYHVLEVVCIITEINIHWFDKSQLPRTQQQEHFSSLQINYVAS